MNKKVFKICVLTILTCFLYSEGYGETKISGRVTDASYKPVSFSNVTLRLANDSAKVVSGTLTDLKGEFTLSTAKAESYYVFVSCLGKETERYRINAKADTLLQISLKDKSVQIDGATVTANMVRHEINKTSYSFTSTQKNGANSSLSLLNGIPSLSVSEVNNSISTTMGQGVLVLINGRTASAIELLSLQPKAVAKVEYYKIPPARYLNSGYASVVNVITKEAIEGGTIFASLQNTPSDKYGNHVFAGDYNRNRSQLMWYYYYSYRNYGDKLVNETREYSAAGNDIKSNRMGDKSPFGYDMHIANLSYINSKDSSYVFSIKASPNLTTSYSKPKYLIVRQLNSSVDMGIGKRYSHTYEFAPSVDVYFSKMLSKNSELLVNSVGSIFDGTSDYSLNEQRVNGSNILFDFMNSTNSKRSLISEVVYTHNCGSFNFNVGVKDSEGKLSQTITNSFGNGDYTMNTSERYGYVEFNGDYRALSLSGSVGATYNSFKQSASANAYSYYTFRPSLKISYQLNERSMVQLSYSKSTTMPTLAELSNQSYFDDISILKTGNPNLKPFDTHTIQLYYTLPVSILTAEFQLTYNYAKNPILTCYINEPTVIRLTPNNEDSKSDLTISTTLGASLLPKNMLDVSVTGWASEITNGYVKKGDVNLRVYGLRVMLQSNYKSFNLTAYYQNPTKSLTDEYVFTGSADSDISLNYRYKKFTFGSGVYLPFHKSYYTKGYTVNSALVKENFNNRIYTNGNMLYFRVVYLLPFGRKMGVDKRINNQDGDSGMIKI